MRLFNLFKELAHIIILPIVLVEGIFAYLRLREERKKRMEERKNCQTVLDRQKVSLLLLLKDINILGDHINSHSTKNVILNKIKETREYLELTLRLGILFSSVDQIELLQNLYYFDGREEKINKVILEFLKQRIRNMNEKWSSSLIEIIDRLLKRLDTQPFSIPKSTA